MLFARRQIDQLINPVGGGGGGGPSFANVQLLAHFDNNLTDSAGKTSLTNDGTTFTGTAYIGTHALNVNNSGSNKVTMDNSNLVLSSGTDFCIELWCYIASEATRNGAILKLGSGVFQFLCELNGGSGFKPGLYQGAAFWTLPTNLSNNTWHNLALVRRSGTVYLYANGTSYTLGSDSSSTVNSGSMIGTNGSENFPGYLDELRITIGEPVYTAGEFTPSNDPFPEA